jgi:hypothetical protein
MWPSGRPTNPAVNMVGTNSSHNNVWQQEHNGDNAPSQNPGTNRPLVHEIQYKCSACRDSAVASSVPSYCGPQETKLPNCRSKNTPGSRLPSPDCSGSLDPVAGPMPCNVERTQAPPRTQGHCLHRATKNHGAWRQNPTYGVVRTAPWNVSHRPLSICQRRPMWKLQPRFQTP